MAGKSTNPSIETQGLREYLLYSRRAWGLAANLSVVIPLANSLGSLTPSLPNPAAITFVITIFNVLIVYAIWSFRYGILKAANPASEQIPGIRALVIKKIDRIVAIPFLAAALVFGIGLVDPTLLGLMGPSTGVIVPNYVLVYFLFFLSLTICFNILTARDYVLGKLNLSFKDYLEQPKHEDQMSRGGNLTGAIVNVHKSDGSDMSRQWVPIQSAQIIIDLGVERGVQVDDKFVVVRGGIKSKDLAQKALGDIPRIGAEIRVVRVDSGFSACQIESLTLTSYGGFGQGDMVVMIPRRERSMFDELRDLEAQANSADAKTMMTEEHFYFEELVRRADRFLLSYNDSYFTPDVLFQKGLAQLKLGRPDSIATFSNFLAKYPFHRSADGARKWINEAQKLVREN